MQDFEGESSVKFTSCLHFVFLRLSIVFNVTFNARVQYHPTTNASPAWGHMEGEAEKIGT